MVRKEFDITRKKRIGGPKGHYYIWILSEHGIDENGFYQYSKTIADFGNIQKKENYQNAKKLRCLLEQELYCLLVVSSLWRLIKEIIKHDSTLQFNK